MGELKRAQELRVDDLHDTENYSTNARGAREGELHE